MGLEENNTAMLESLIEGVRNQNPRMLARAISLVENEDELAEELLSRMFRYAGNALRIGITGPPGAGKSTLTSRVARIFRKSEKKVGIIAVDPTSPFSGGAVLGDRIRMTELSDDPGVFIRSMATRGSLGGLSKTAQDVADLMDAAGMDLIILETVGVGQGELDVARTADTTVVVLVPESGDSIQAMKAGLMEIADIFVINKSDRDGANKMQIELQMMLQLRPAEIPWKPPIIKTVASQSGGVDELVTKLDEHFRFQKKTGKLREKNTERANLKIRQLLLDSFEESFWTSERRNYLDSKIAEVIEHRISPYDLVQSLMQISKD